MSTRRLTSELVVRLTDRVTAPARNIAGALLGIRNNANGLKGADFGTRLSDAMRNNQRQIARTRGQLVDAAAGFYAIKAAIASPISAAMRFESAMADVAKVVDFETPASFGQFQRDLEELSTTLPISAEALADIAASAGEAGFKADELLKVTEAAAKIGVAFGISAEQAGEALPQLMNSMGLSLDEVLLLSDGINHLSNNMAASAPKVLEFMGRIGGDISKFGFSAEEASAFGAAMIAAGAQSDVAATSFRNMGNRLTKGASATKRQSDAFKALGMDATDVAENMQRDAVGTTLSVIEAISALPKAQQAALMSDLFGDEARALAPLLSNTDLLREALGLVADEAEYAGSAMKEFAIRNGASEAQAARFMNGVTNLKAAIGRGLIPVLIELMDRINPVVKGLSNYANAHPELIGKVVAATAAVVAFRSAMIGLKFIGLIGRGGALSLLSLGFNTVGKSALKLRFAVGESIRLSSTLAGMSGLRLGWMGRIAAGLRGIAGVTGLSAISGAITAVVGAIAAISAPLWLGIGAAIAAVGVAWKYWDRITAIVSGVAKAIGSRLSPVLDPIREKLSALEPIIAPIGAAFSVLSSAVGDAWNSIKEFFSGSLFSRESLSDDDIAAITAKSAELTGKIIDGFSELTGKLYEVGRSAILSLWDGMKAKFFELLEWVRSIPDMIVEAIGNIDLSGMIRWPQLPQWLRSSDGPPAEAPAGASLDGQRASGGPMSPGRTYLTGEKGPELITPDRASWVTTNREIIDGLRERARAAASVPAAGARSAPAAARSVSLTMGDVIVQGVDDARAIADQVIGEISDRLNAAVDGGHFD